MGGVGGPIAEAGQRGPGHGGGHDQHQVHHGTAGGGVGGTTDRSDVNCGRRTQRKRMQDSPAR